jgi:cytochrome P450
MATIAPLPGELLLDRATLDDPNPFYHRLVEQAPVWRVGDADIFTVSSHAAVTEACRRVEDFSSNLRYYLYRDDRGLPAREPHRNSGGSDFQVLATADPPVHARHKKVISPEFSPVRLAALERRLVTMTEDGLVAGLASGRIEFMVAVANMIPIEIITDLIAFRKRNTAALFRTATGMTDQLAAAISFAELMARVGVTDATNQWVFAQLQDALDTPAEGILGLLASAMNAGEIDAMIAMAILMTLFSAGGESTSSLIGNSVLLLAKDRDLQQRLREQPSLIPRLVEEALRLESPFRQHMRLATRTSSLCGVEIPEGSTLLMLWGAANRDPAKFDRAEEVDLDRPRQHVGFGSGIHVCLGNTLARLEARILLETLLAATSAFALDEAEAAQWVPSLAVRRLRTLPLVMTSR